MKPDTLVDYYIWIKINNMELYMLIKVITVLVILLWTLFLISLLCFIISLLFRLSIYITEKTLKRIKFYFVIHSIRSSMTEEQKEMTDKLYESLIETNKDKLNLWFNK